MQVTDSDVKRLEPAGLYEVALALKVAFECDSKATHIKECLGPTHPPTHPTHPWSL